MGDGMVESTKAKGGSEGSAAESGTTRRRSSRLADAFKSGVLAAALLTSTFTPTASASPTERHRDEPRPATVERGGSKVERFVNSQSRNAAQQNRQIHHVVTSPVTLPRPPRLNEARSGFVVQRPPHPIYVNEGWHAPRSERERAAFFGQFFVGIEVNDLIRVELANSLQTVYAKSPGRMVYLVNSPNGLEVVTEFKGVVVGIDMYTPQLDGSMLCTRYSPRTIRQGMAPNSFRLAISGGRLLYADLSLNL